jgi:UDP-N-acetyl-D-galactosamine dehydrogenase
VAVIGLGYVGFPLAIALAESFPTVGFDIDERRLAELRAGNDRTGEVESAALRRSALVLTSDPEALKGVTMFVVAVPTPVDANHVPDLGPLRRASELVGTTIRPGAIAVFESTVYPGVTEEVCGPIIERLSGLRRPEEFTLAYSPERANPGDRNHGLRQIVKVVSGEDEATLARVAHVYSRIVPAGLHIAPSIKVAEAAKVIENTQRDLNIALMNELAMIFERLGISTRDVLAAAGTKWNFLPFTPGLVGGHCIGVDPYYLTSRAEAAGYHPEIILAGRRINDGMGAFIAQKVVKEFVRARLPANGSVGVLGLTFKENVPDRRNSRVPDIVRELVQFGIAVVAHDPLAEPSGDGEDGITSSPIEDFRDLHGLILAVPHRQFLEMERRELFAMLRPGGILFDIKSAISPPEVPPDIGYWSL